MEIEQVARKAGLPVGVIERLEKGGGTATLIGNEKSAIKRVFGRSVEDLARPLTDDVKTALLHGLPLEKSGDK
jgi:hypothetical protein